MRGGVKKQLTIYDAISDTESASLMNPISEHQTQALQRFLEKGKDGSLV